MFIRVLLVLVAIVGSVIYFMPDSAYSRTVDASPDRVRAALYSLDIRTAPGAPATDPSVSAGLPSNFGVTQEGDDMVWTVTNGEKVAVRMIAHLEPVDGGAKTLVTTRYERGDAPDDHVAPAFRSKGVTMGLFALVLEDKLDSVTMPVSHAWDVSCDKIMKRFEQGDSGGSGTFGGPEAKSLKQAVGNTALHSMQLSALDKELKAAGCPANNNGADYRPDEEGMVSDFGASSPPRVEQAEEPAYGEPMIDPTPDE